MQLLSWKSFFLVGEDVMMSSIGGDFCQICFHSQELHKYSSYYSCLADLVWLAWLLMRDHAVVGGGGTVTACMAAI